MHRLIEHSLPSVADRDQTHSNYALMRNLLEFTAFIEAELPELLARWRERRTTTSTPSAGAGDDPHLHTGGTT